jgi:hypothetical protein
MLIDQELSTRLGPARVLQAAGRRVQLELPDEAVWAVMALAYPYQPAPGDTVLAVGQDGDWYVIGVLSGAGTTTLTVPGDLAIRAPRGAIEITAAKGVRVKSPVVEVIAHRLEHAAKSVMERFGRATRWVREELQVRAGRLRTRVDSTYDLRAERVLARAEDDVKIDGRQIDLG